MSSSLSIIMLLDHKKAAKTVCRSKNEAYIILRPLTPKILDPPLLGGLDLASLAP